MSALAMKQALTCTCAKSLQRGAVPDEAAEVLLLQVRGGQQLQGPIHLYFYPYRHLFLTRACASPSSEAPAQMKSLEARPRSTAVW